MILNMNLEKKMKLIGYHFISIILRIIDIKRQYLSFVKLFFIFFINFVKYGQIKKILKNTF